MTEATKYRCKGCGQVHEEWPALTFKAPDNYHFLSAADQEAMAEISSDFCVITHPTQTDRFIRCTLTQKVMDHCQDLDYGVWVSLSENSFEDYTAHDQQQEAETTYFGWLCNAIPEYTFEKSIPTTVFTRKDNLRPEVVPHQSVDHPFVKDYYSGITKQEAEKRIRAMFNGTGQEKALPQERKPWWKIW